jgi:nitrite reductase (NADH) small subunit/3-phenylpropionate/trans-cinnamate dioxygenase ferredoxin subunit
VSEFVKVASISDLPAGQAILVEVEGRSIAIFNVNGEVYALDNICSHRGGPLCEGFIDPNNLTVQCPWHGWVYSLASGASPLNPFAKVERFDVMVEGEEVKLSLD